MRNISLSILLALTSSLMAADFTPTPLPPLFVDREEPIVFPEDAVVIERFMPFWDNQPMNIQQQSKRTVIVRDINGTVYQEAMGDVFLPPPAFVWKGTLEKLDRDRAPRRKIPMGRLDRGFPQHRDSGGFGGSSEKHQALTTMKTTLHLLALSAFFSGQIRAADDVVTLTYPGSAKAGELSCEANFYLWLPPGVKTVRGIIVHQHGCGDGAERGCLAAAEDLHWRELAEKRDCALLGTSYRAGDSNCGAWADPRHGSQARFHQALRDFSEKTAHPEIADAPWCLWGHSGGGWWASVMLALEPQRCVAVWLRSGSAYGSASLSEKDTPPPVVSAEVLRVPVMANPGVQEKDDDRFKKAYFNTLETFTAWRAKGALIGFAADPHANHDCGGSRYLAIPFFDACLVARLPEKSGSPLKNMPLQNAWLAPLHGDTAQPAADFTGDKNAAVWLPNAAVAKAWSEYVKTAAVSDTTPPPAPTDVQMRDGVLTWKARADFESGLRGFIIERDGEPIATLPGKQNERTVFQGLGFHDTPSQPVPAMHFTDPAPKPGAKYRVIAINTVGLKSE